MATKAKTTIHATDAEPTFGQSADRTPTASAIDEMTADPYHDKEVAAYEAELLRQAVAAFNSPQPNDRDPDLGVRIAPDGPGDALANVAHAPQPNYVKVAGDYVHPPLASTMHLAAVDAVTAAFGPRK